MSENRRGAGRAPRTLLERLIWQREATYEEQAEAFARLARQLGEPATLSVRHLQRLASGQRSGEHATPSMRRVLRQLYGHRIEELLADPQTPSPIPSRWPHRDTPVPAPPTGVPDTEPMAELVPEVDDEIEALELARRVAASDVGDTTLTQLERAVDELASSYTTSHPAHLLGRTRKHLRYVGRLLDARTTLSERRRLLVAGGWLSLFAATLHVDLAHQGAALARLATADSLAREGGHDEIRAWCLETEAWRVLTLGDYHRAAELARQAQQLAPSGTSALIQATAQEGRAWARLGDTQATQQAIDRVNQMVVPLATPDRPEHHYRYDPAKATSYLATTLSWVGDPAAVDFAREVIASLSADHAPGGRPRRLASARLDLALALIRQGQLDEAAQAALRAITSGKVAPSNRWRALEVVHAAEGAGSPDAATLREAYRELVRTA